MAVPRTQLRSLWPFVAKLLKKSVDLSSHKISMPDILEGAKNGVYSIWVVTENNEKIVAAIATRIVVYPRANAFAIEFVGGSKMSKWIDVVLDTLQKVAIHNNCSFVEGYGRTAWLRYLEKRGFKSAFCTFEKELKDG
tara:strand:+ start:1902 stop:2315 length:414 start_codon:yes stop_codon:yes gene_type:complete